MTKKHRKRRIQLEEYIKRQLGRGVSQKKGALTIYKKKRKRRNS